MPIPREQLSSPKASEPPLEERVLEFLRKGPSQAFDLMEILAALEGYRDSREAADTLLAMGSMEQEALIERYRDALGFLILEGEVVAGEFQGVGYYGVARP